MSQIDVIKESVRYEQLLKEDSTKHILKGEYLLRDSQYPDMKEVLGVEAKSIITGKEVLGDKVMVEGEVEYVVFYVSKDEENIEMEANEIHAVTFNDKFANYLDINNDEHNVICNVECDVEHIEVSWMNERKVSISGVLLLKWEVYKDDEFEYVKDIEGKEDVQIQKLNEEISVLKGEKEVELLGKAMLKASMDKKEIGEIIKTSFIIHKKEVKSVEGKIYIGCYCKISVLYKAKDANELYVLEDDIYLSKEEEIVTASSGSITDMNLKVDNKHYAINLDDVGENRIIDIELVIKGKVKLYCKESIEVVKDSYSPTLNIEIEKDNKNLSLVHSVLNTEIVVKDNIEIENNDNRIDEIVLSTGQVLIKDKTIEDEKVKIDGEVKTYIIYKFAGEGNRYGFLKGENPFSTTVDVRGLKKDMDVIIKNSLESIDTNIEVNSISIKSTINLCIKIYEKINKEFIKDIIEGEEEVKEKDASIIIYSVEKGDTLWKLAKKYNTTVAEIERLNDIENPNEINIGEMLMIPGRATF